MNNGSGEMLRNDSFLKTRYLEQNEKGVTLTYLFHGAGYYLKS
jgi:hypothetical protein